MKISQQITFEGVWGQVRSKKLFPETTPDKIFETNSSFNVKLHTMGKVQFPFSRSFGLVLTKFSF